jgi:hypothetical protein
MSLPIIRTYPKASALATAMVALTLLIGCGSRSVVDKSPEVPEDLIAMVSLRNPKDFFSDISTVIRRTDPTGMAINQLGGVLEGYGYPLFPAFDPVRRLGVFALTPPDDSDEPEWFVMAMLTPDAPIIQNMREMGATVLRMGTWTVAAENEAVLDRIENIYTFAELLETHPDEDMTLRLFPRVLKQFESKIRQQAREQLGEFTELDANRWMPYLDWALNEVKSLHAFGMGLNLSAESLTLSYAIDAKAGTPIGDMVKNLPSRHSLELGKFIEAGKMANFVSRNNPNAVRAYIDHLYSSLTTAASSEDALLISALWQQMEPVMDSIGPAGFFAIHRLADPMRYTQLSEANIDRERFIAAYEWFYNDAWQLGMNTIATSFGETPMPPMEVELNPEAHTHEGVSIAQVSFTIDTEALDAVTTTDFSSLSDDLGHYFAIHRGNYLAASELDALKALISAKAQGQAVANNLQGRFQFAPNDILQGNLDLAAVILQTLNELQENGIPAEPWLKQLFADAKLDMLFHGYTKEQSLIVEAELPVETIIQLVTRGFTLFMMQALGGN